MEIRIVSEAIVTNLDKKILVLRRSTEAPRRPGEWDLPGGHVDQGEYLAETAARETAEETGLTIDSQEITLVYAMTEMAEDGNSVTWLYFLASTGLKDVRLSHEHDEYKWVPISEAIELIKYPRQLRALRHIADNDLLAAVEDQ